jgi:hypothetical protein
MAKVDTLEFHVNGEDYKSNINVGKAGIFKCELHWQVAQVLGIESSLTSSTLDGVKKPIMDAYTKFKDAKTETFLWIKIIHAASGKYLDASRGGSRLSDNPFAMNGFSGDGDRIEFDFNLYIQEKYHTGTSSWWKARHGNPNWNIKFIEEKEDPDTLYKENSVFNIRENDLMIPYTKEGYQTLVNAKESLKKISYGIQDFLSQDKQVLMEALNGGKMIE